MSAHSSPARAAYEAYHRDDAQRLPWEELDLFGKQVWGVVAGAAIAADPPYPRQDGDVMLLGPDCFTALDGVICWKGENYRAPDTTAADSEPVTAEVLPMPPGRWARVELPGRRENTGWINEETRYGTQMLIVRDWNGAELTAVAIGPACRVVYLATPLHHPEQAPLALPAAPYDAWSGDYDEPEGPF